jgi:hypothetical protein
MLGVAVVGWKDRHFWPSARSSRRKGNDERNLPLGGEAETVIYGNGIDDACSLDMYPDLTIICNGDGVRSNEIRRAWLGLASASWDRPSGEATRGDSGTSI